MFKVGDWVTLATLPEWVDRLPAPSQAVVRFCLGRSYRVDEIDEWGQLVLDVSIDVDEKFGGFMNDLRVEPEYLVADAGRAAQHLRSERLRLRPPRLDDAEAIFSRWAGDPEATRFLGWQRHQSLDDTRAFIEFSETCWKKDGCGPLLIVERQRVIGSTGLQRDGEGAETGYVLERAAWGRGIASEAVMAVLSSAKSLRIPRIEARCHLENRASQRVLEKCGFRLEEVRPRAQIFPNLGRGVAEDVQRWVVVP